MENDDGFDNEEMKKAYHEIFNILIGLSMAERTSLVVNLCAHHLGYIHAEFMPMVLSDIQQGAASIRNEVLKFSEEQKKNTR